ncbi:hypothetical protein [Larkinella rosea]|uniref:Uncharacterized protein n=1 Tax=Larkinella rosea TaxID=2025312 RepID=A0A3P1BE72_9BACT|nr:hypothetical protein [Larkinella rosea]RRA98833.1 hypothetical protein EHT25_27975 [Larkinella rosea]
MDTNVPFSDTSARRAELMEATEQYKSSIETNVKALKEDAAEVGKTVALVAGVCLAVYVVASIVIPKSDKSDSNYDEDDYEEVGESTRAHARRAAKAAEEAPARSAIGGAITGIVTSILTNLARQQVTDFISRLRQDNATTHTQPGQYP